MKAAMAPLALLAIVAGCLQVPGVTDALEHFLEPTFADSAVRAGPPQRPARSGSASAVGGMRLDRRDPSPRSIYLMRNPELRLRIAGAVPAA